VVDDGYTVDVVGDFKVHGVSHLYGDADSTGGLELTGSIIAGNITATPTANYVPKADAGGTLNAWVTGRIINSYSGTNSGGTITTDGGGTWTTVISLSINPAAASTVIANGSAGVSAGYDNTPCYMRLAYDGTSAMSHPYVPGLAHYTKFTPFSDVGRLTAFSGSHTITLQIKDDAVSGHPCSVAQNDGVLVVQVISE